MLVFFYSSLDPQGIAVGGILGGLENTHVKIAFRFFFSVMYMIHCLFTVKLHTAAVKITCADDLHEKESTDAAHNV